MIAQRRAEHLARFNRKQVLKSDDWMDQALPFKPKLGHRSTPIECWPAWPAPLKVLFVMRKKQVVNPAMTPEARAALESVLTAGHFILEWTDGVNEHRLWADKQKRAAIEREFEIIAESLRRLQRLDPRMWHDIKDADIAIRLGEAIRRDYDAIDYGILWRATRNELPEMLQRVEALQAAARHLS